MAWTRQDEERLLELQRKGQWGTPEVLELNNRRSSASQFERTLAQTPELPKVDFSQLMRRRQVGTPEYAAQKAQITQDAQRQQQLAARQLAAQQARSGVRGGAAGAQQARLAEQAQLKRANAEQALFAKNIAEREKLEKAAQFGGLSSDLARMQLASAELGQQRGLQAANVTADAQRAAAAGASGCPCFMIVATTIAFNVDAARADYLKEMSKLGEELNFEVPAEKEMIRHLQGIRKIRDSWCAVEELRGYYWLSETVGHYAAKNKTATKFFFNTCVKPTVACAEGKAGFFDKLLTKTWIKFFGLFGSDKPFTRSNGEVV